MWGRLAVCGRLAIGLDGPHIPALPALVALAASICASPAFGAQIPRQTPEFVFNMGPGSQQLLSAYKGKTIVLAFMYGTCPHCQKTAKVLEQIQKEYESRGVRMLGALFQQGDAARVVQFREALGLGFPVGVSDTRTVLEYLQLPLDDPYFVPILVFIDKRGMIRSQYVGDEKFLDRQETNIRAEIDKLLKAGATVPKIPKTPKS